MHEKSLAKEFNKLSQFLWAYKFAKHLCYFVKWNFWSNKYETGLVGLSYYIRNIIKVQLNICAIFFFLL